MNAEAIFAWRVERVCYHAWPALRQERSGDWVFRFSNGLTKRANSVNPWQAPRGDLTAMLAAARAAYAREKLPLIVRLPSLVDTDIAQQLAARGFTSEGETLTLYCELPQMPMRCDPDVTIQSHPDDAWLRRLWTLKGFDEDSCRTHRAILSKIADPVAFMGLRIFGDIVALGFVVIHDNLLCIESLITDPAQRGKGHGRRLLGAMLAWGINQSVAGACLQVTAQNAAAIRLYRGMGFSHELYRYKYWRMTPAG